MKRFFFLNQRGNYTLGLDCFSLIGLLFTEHKLPLTDTVLVYSSPVPPGRTAHSYQQKAPGALWESRLSGSPFQGGSPPLGAGPALLTCR